jgi:hypothetical protein
MDRAMAKRAERGPKSGKASKGDRWTVRGVSAKLQKAAGDAARVRGLTLGQWLSEVLGSALAQHKRTAAPAAEEWEQAVERRLARLEAAVLDESATRTEAPSVGVTGRT